MRPDDDAPKDKSSHLKAFRDLLGRDLPDLAGLEHLLPDLSQAGLLETALAECRSRTRDRASQALWKPFRQQLEAGAAQARARRMATWQHDPERRTLWLKVALTPPFTDLHPPQRLHALAAGLRAADLAVGLGLEKAPRPLIAFAHPLPLGTEGRNEWVEVGLSEPPKVPLAQLAGHAAPHLPEGVDLLEARLVPNHATPLAELCTGSHWVWTAPESLYSTAQARLEAFRAAERWTLEKSGKVEGQKALKHVEVRNRVMDLAWEGRTLQLHLKQESGEALNPAKLLAGILGVDPGQILNLVRLRLDLREDPRIQAADRFAPKLHNIWEDAVLLESSDGPATVEDEDEDEPLKLG